jgi:predicted lysophospholipase L1 biosynthesis ABC-type transport system permease subunit
MGRIPVAPELACVMAVQFLGAMGWVMIVVGAAGLASTMSLGVLERTREVGVLRALGARDLAVLGIRGPYRLQPACGRQGARSG